MFNDTGGSMPTGHSPDVMRWVTLFLLLSHESYLIIYCFFVLDLQHITSFYPFHRWLDPQKLVRKQVRRNSSHNSSSSNAKESSGSTHHQNGHAQKTSTGSGSSTNNVIILYFRVKFYVTGTHIIIHNNYYNTLSVFGRMYNTTGFVLLCRIPSISDTQKYKNVT